MKEIIVTNEMDNQRLDKYLKRLLPSCPHSLLYKQLRKKNITLNGSKADGSETIREGDVVKIFFSDETYEKFSAGNISGVSRYSEAYYKLKCIEIIEETDDYIVFCKPAGILSQSDDSGDPSINDYLLGYLLSKGEITPGSMLAFKPSVCNRLDRNTSGLITCSKNLQGARYLNSFFKERKLEKYYLALVRGKFDAEGDLNAYVKKDEKANRLTFVNKDDPGAMEIKNGFKILRQTNDCTLLMVHLYTGKSHQIRAHLSHLGHPIIGDPKYGGTGGRPDAKRQMLHAYLLKMTDEDSPFSGKCFKAPIPADMLKICASEFGSVEDLNL
ncbi:MAG: RluA family pseudouridine synthase [Lachnospiraceae bacterium]|nr:RluA family pseudouridine synthase [Lachnospiraceae bacterium]